MFGNIVRVYFVSLCIVIPYAHSVCNLSTNGFRRFGPDCMYTCHCNNASEQCNDVTGECISGCEDSWLGPGCQYKDVALNGNARHIDNNNNYAKLANDGNLNTCSRTNKAANSRTTPPWWRLWLPSPTLIKGLVIITETGSLNFFSGFNVFVEAYANSNDPFTYTNRLICYIDNGSTITDTTIHVTCNEPTVDNQVRIQLATKDSQLVLCDVRIYGECPINTCGLDCTEVCHCKRFPFSDKISGKCTDGCDGRWTGLNGKCDIECSIDQWGPTCNYNCGHCRNSDPCNPQMGRCANGCADGYYQTDTCVTPCNNGRYGPSCAYTCRGHCKDGAVCDRSNGHCPGGCAAGWQGDMCNSACSTGFYGDGCSGTCSGHCDGGNSRCNKVDGTCNLQCISGWSGYRCDKACVDWQWGKDCLKPCGHCSGGPCHKFNGTCSRGCDPGYQLSLECDLACEQGFYGLNCTEVCGNCSGGVSECGNTNGACRFGCISGFGGDNCLTALELSTGRFTLVARIGGGVAAVVVIAAIVLVFFFIIRRRRLHSNAKRNNNGPSEVRTSADVINDVELHTNPYTCLERIDEPDPYDTIEATASDDNAYEMMSETGFSQDYINIPQTDGRRELPINAVLVSDLGYHIRHEVLAKGSIVQEFDKLPSGLIHPATVAQKTANKAKNRYKKIYAYDTSRVVLNKLSGQPASDYINACFINGHLKKNAYIAAQGPSTETVVDFWRMIWEYDIQKVVMLTNLVESDQLQCAQYWPADGQDEYGSVSVKLVSEEVMSQWTIRTLVTKSKSDKQQKLVTQYHFTSWSEDTPIGATGVVQFLSNVRQGDENRAQPWVVHCSNGIGRTGIFIALDNLFEQGKALGYVNVYQCVHDIRQQRVSMVQTLEQYQFLYDAVYEMVCVPCYPIPVPEFQKEYNILLITDQRTQKTGIQCEYKNATDDVKLDKMMELQTETEQDADVKDVFSASKLPDNVPKNRFMDIVPRNDCRPILMTPVPGCNNYINAVFIPSYTRKDGYILTQVPLKSTTIDCCRLIYEQNVKTIVTYEDYEREQVGDYLPEIGSLHIGPFEVTLTSKEELNDITTRTYRLHHEESIQQHDLKQFILKKWLREDTVPADYDAMLDLIQNVEDHQKQADDNPVMVQCFNGAERSGLFVALSNILERLRIEQEVAIPQVIRHMRQRRQQIIPNFEQFKFCYDAVLHYITRNKL